MSIRTRSLNSNGVPFVVIVHTGTGLSADFKGIESVQNCPHSDGKVNKPSPVKSSNRIIMSSSH